MDQDKTVNKIMFWLLHDKIIQPEHQNKVRGYLEQVYVAGWEESGKWRGDKRSMKIIQEDDEHNEIGRFPSIEVAAKMMKCTPRTIREALKTGEMTSGKITGHRNYWRYADEPPESIL